MLNRQPINPPEALREAASEATPTPSIPVSPTIDEVHNALNSGVFFLAELIDWC